jgi:membrane protein insertase Oxa1/YidC/SpoIIIJ
MRSKLASEFNGKMEELQNKIKEQQELRQQEIDENNAVREKI